MFRTVPQDFQPKKRELERVRETPSRYDHRMRTIAIVLFLAACGPKIVSSTPRSVTVDGVNESTIAKATELAQEECAKNGRDAELASTDDMARGMNTKAVTFKCVDPASATTITVQAPPAAKPASADERKVIIGSKPLYCAVTAPDVGACYQAEANCTESLAEGAAPCEAKPAGACFNATKVLDGSKSTTCAVSIKDCETRRTELAANPDYKVTACGIYRVEK